ncbi:MAG: glycoside hydrolase family 2 TIM barrel-domain containing protein, partial [bacterium]
MAKASILRLVISVVLFQFLPLQSVLSQYEFLENGNPLHRGSDVGFLPDTPTRKKIDLTGIWTYKVSDGPEGTVHIPCAYDFTGEVTFQRSFEITADDLNKYQFQLVMLGANYTSAATVNNDFIANHIGGYTSFVAPITSSVLQAGTQNVIKIVTDNKLDPTRTIPLRSQVWGWRNYGGITRDVYILATPKVFISNVVVTPTLSVDFSVAKIAVSALIDGSLATDDSTVERLQWYVELIDKQTNIPVATSNTVLATFQNKAWTTGPVELTINAPRLWSPDKPDMYIVKAHLVNPARGEKLDEYDVNTGLRKIDFVNGRVIVNGKKTLLKGVIWMEDHKSYGSSLPYEVMEKDIDMIRSVGANAIRFGDHPPHPYMLSLCDRYGILALEEISVKNVPASILSQEYYVELAGARMREMITRDRNHPCVFAWGLGDDFDVWSASSRVYVEQLAKVAHGLDARPIYYATNSASDLCSDLVDITAVSLNTRDIKEFKNELDDLRIASAG